MQLTSAPRTIESIQHLRALAALGVVVFHALGLLEKQFGVEVTHKDLGAAGVDLFFVISGFIMWVTAVARDERPVMFARKRILRIVPLYWLITTLVLAIVVVKPELMRSASRDAAHFLASYFFIAWPHPAVADRLWPPVIPGWTLNYEMFFYAVVTLSLFLARARRLPLLAMVLIALPLAGWLLQPSGLLEFYTSPILLEFLFGVLIGQWFTRGGELKSGVSLALVMVALLAFFTVGLEGSEHNRVWFWGVPLALLVVGALGAPALAQGAIRGFSKLLGDASYSLYLTQFIVLPPAAKVLGKISQSLALPWGGVLLVVGLIGVAVVAGVLSYLLVERPIQRALKARRRAAAQPEMIV
jgi:exopolysaccharide production protein ExoZ